MPPRSPLVYAQRPRVNKYEYSRHWILFFYVQLLRDYIRSMDDMARPTPRQLFRDVAAYFRGLGFNICNQDVARTLNGAAIQLIPEIFDHAEGVRELDPVNKKIVKILNMSISCFHKYGARQLSIDVFSPDTEYPRPDGMYYVNYKWYSSFADAPFLYYLFRGVYVNQRGHRFH